MRILVISDSHNHVLNSHIEKIKQYERFDMLIHCGDKYKDADEFAQLLEIENIIKVPGNCDLISDKPLVIQKIIEGKKLLITHGHLHNVKINIETLKEFAKNEKADAVIYGHTHCSQNEIIDNILFFNPGSTMYPRCKKESFGILEISINSIKGLIIEL